MKFKIRGRIQKFLNWPPGARTANGIPKKLVRLIKMCLNETYNKVGIGKLLSGKFPIQNGLK
jgi:hypothetical protein